MARKNTFRDQETDFLGLLENESLEDNFTKSVVRDLDSEIESANEILTASPDMFIPFENEKLRLDLHYGEDRERLKESIKLNGIFTPVICVLKNEKLMILSGHNRVDIAKELKIEVPYILKSDLSNEEMELICIDDNLIHRQRNDYKPMQLAYSIKVKMDAERHQGATLSTGYSKLSGDKVGEEHGLSRKMINIYLKLNELSDEIKVMVDNKDIAIKTAYELAFLDNECQLFLANYINKYKFSVKNIREIRQKMNEKNFNSLEEKKKFLESQILKLCVPGTQAHKLDFKNIRKYIPDNIDDNNTEAYIINALKYYNENNQH